MKLSELLTLDLNKDIIHDNINTIFEAKFARTPIDIGDGFYLKKVGLDMNGNWSYWVSRGNNGFRKIQASNINGGSNKIVDVNDANATEYADTIREIKRYFLRYMTESIDNNVNIFLSDANYERIPDTLSYKIKNLPVDYNNSKSIIADAGVLNLNITPTALAEALSRDDGDAIEITSVALNSPFGDVSTKVDNFYNISNSYTVKVTYKDKSGNVSDTVLDFTNAEFIPSEEFNQHETNSIT